MRLRTAGVGAGAAAVLLAGCNLGSPAVSYAAPGRDVAVGDIDEDGNMDLVSIGWGHATDSGFDLSDSAVFVGDGTGGFSVSYPDDPTDFDTKGDEVELVDLSGDGHLDLLRTVNHNVNGIIQDELGVQLGDGQGGFGAPTITHVPGLGQFTDMRTGDLNGDGSTDVVLLDNQFAGLEVLLGDGTGGFSTISTFSAWRTSTPTATSTS